MNFLPKLFIDIIILFFGKQLLESKNRSAARVKMKTSNGFEREGLQKTLPRANPMQIRRHLKSNRQKADCCGKWSVSLIKRNCLAQIVTNWCRFVIASVVRAHWAATFRMYSFTKFHCSSLSLSFTFKLANIFSSSIKIVFLEYKTHIFYSKNVEIL